MKELLQSKNWLENMHPNRKGILYCLCDLEHDICKIGTSSDTLDKCRKSNCEVYPFDCYLVGFDVKSTYHAVRYYKEYFKDKLKKGAWYNITKKEFLELREQFESDLDVSYESSPKVIEHRLDEYNKQKLRDWMIENAFIEFTCKQCRRKTKVESEMKEHIKVCKKGEIYSYNSWYYYPSIPWELRSYLKYVEDDSRVVQSIFEKHRIK